MVVLTVIYPKSTESWFDLEYYSATHVPLVKTRLQNKGLEDLRVLRGMAALDGAEPGFEMIAQLFFPSLQHVHDALKSHGQEIMADIPKFTNIHPTLQINEPIL